MSLTYCKAFPSGIVVQWCSSWTDFNWQRRVASRGFSAVTGSRVFSLPGNLFSAFPSSVEVSSDDYIVGGENLTLTCRVGCVGYGSPSITWKHNGRQYIYSASQFVENDNETYPGMRVRVSEQQIIVPLHAGYLAKYSCHVNFWWRVFYFNYRHRPSDYTNINFRRTYSWTTPTIKVSCEYN